VCIRKVYGKLVKIREYSLTHSLQSVPLSPHKLSHNIPLSLPTSHTPSLYTHIYSFLHTHPFIYTLFYTYTLSHTYTLFYTHLYIQNTHTSLTYPSSHTQGSPSNHSYTLLTHTTHSYTHHIQPTHSLTLPILFHSNLHTLLTTISPSTHTRLPITSNSYIFSYTLLHYPSFIPLQTYTIQLIPYIPYTFSHPKPFSPRKGIYP
jgi:hypothetical protein